MNANVKQGQAGTTAIATITNEINATRAQFMAVLSDQSINFEREAGFAVQALMNNDFALEVAQKNKASLIAAVTNIAAIGISLNPAKKQAYLVPRKPAANKPAAICLDLSYMGLIELAVASGSIRWAQAELVYPADHFELHGVDQPPLHKRDPFAKDRGDWIGVYVVAKTADGDYLTTTMSRDDVLAIRDRSEAWKAFVRKDIRSCPWASDEGEMVKKTVIKRASKLWPKTDRLDHAIHYLNTDGGEGLVDINEPPKRPDPVKKTLGKKGFAAAIGSIREGHYDAESLRTNYALNDEQAQELAALEKELGKC